MNKENTTAKELLREAYNKRIQSDNSDNWHEFDSKHVQETNVFILEIMEAYANKRVSEALERVKVVMDNIAVPKSTPYEEIEAMRQYAEYLSNEINQIKTKYKQ